MSKQLPVVGGHPTGFGATSRPDNWWVGPAATFLGLLTFLAYAHWAAFQGEHYYAHSYLSPFYSPVLWTDLAAAGSAPVEHAWLGIWPEWWPSFLPKSPALLILVFPAGFRFTCYYYRKAYYRSFAGSPPGCSVGPMAPSGKTYHGEGRLLLFQNLHRYFMYAALLYIPILFYDAFLAFYNGGNWGVGVGCFVLLLNASLLSCYTLGCHSFRHLIGGRSDCMTPCGKATTQFKLWKMSTWFNGRHMAFAWVSLFWVGFTDLYVRLVSMGVIHDYNTW
ncbi:MAG: succinate dehydrogenase [Planctomycetes bacterium]|nr:succinate dehydrogenase [Planctomycetota bacterium]